jgi:predicted permease
VNAEVEREIAFYLELRTREFEEQGLTPESARAAALAAFGDVQSVLAQCRAERQRRTRRDWRREVTSGMLNDIRFALRSLRRNSAFAAAVVLTLGAGVGLTAATTGLVDAYLWRGLPYPASDRLVHVEGTGSPDWQDAPSVLETVVAWDLDALSIVSDGSPERVWASWVTPGFFPALGVQPQLGRFFTMEEAGAGGAAVAVISYDLWQRRWGGDANVLGRTFAAYSDDRPDDAEVFTVIGVLPADFWYFNRFTEVLAPLRTSRAVSLAVLTAGVSPAQAQSVLEASARARDPARASVVVERVQDRIAERARPMLTAVAGAVLLVLLLACGNAAVLLLVRAAGREREFALRAAIGAGRGRIARQLLIEGVVLAAGAAIVSLLLAWLLLDLSAGTLIRVTGITAPGGEAAIRLDGTALLAALAAGTVAAIVFAVIPHFAASRLNLGSTLAEGARGTDPGKRQRTRSALVAAEIALSLSLLVVAGLLVRSAAHLQRLSLGFDPAAVFAVDMSLRERDYADPVRRGEFWERVVADVRSALPGAQAALVTWAPFSRAGGWPVETPGQPVTDSTAVAAFVAAASQDYFETLAIPLIAGMTFDDTHVRGGPPVAVVSASLADRLWPDRDPIGELIRPATDPMMNTTGPSPWLRVIGVVADVRKTLIEENPPDLYVAMAQDPGLHAELVVRDPRGRSRLNDLREAVWSTNREVPLNTVRWIEDDVAAANLPSRFLALLLTGFAGFALILATLGLYGVVAFAVVQSRRDIAIRMALGATRTSVVSLFLGRSARLVAAGIAAGSFGGWALARLVSSLLHGVQPGDALTWIAMAALLVVVALVATWLPAWRAARTEPMQVLHSG